MSEPTDGPKPPRTADGGAARPAGRPADRRPPGEGWDDGKGNRPAAKATRSGASGGGRGGRGSGAGGPGGRRPGQGSAGGGSGPSSNRPPWLIPAVAGGVVLLLIIGLVVVLRGGGDRKDAGPCLSDLLTHVPEREGAVVWGSDLVAARSAGYQDDGTLEELGTSQEETGTLPDALSARYRFSRLMSTEDFTARTGVEPGDIDCSLSDANGALLSGSFDPTEVAGSELGADGELEATDELLAVRAGDRDPGTMLETRKGDGLAGNDDVVAALESLRDRDGYSVLVQAGNPNAEKRPRAGGVAVAEGDGDAKVLLVAYAFADGDAAKAGRSRVVDLVNAAVKGVASIGVVDLTVDGSLVTAEVPTAKALQVQELIARNRTLVGTD